MRQRRHGSGRLPNAQQVAAQRPAPRHCELPLRRVCMVLLPAAAVAAAVRRRCRRSLPSWAPPPSPPPAAAPRTQPQCLAGVTRLLLAVRQGHCRRRPRLAHRRSRLSAWPPSPPPRVRTEVRASASRVRPSALLMPLFTGPWSGTREKATVALQVLHPPSPTTMTATARPLLTLRLAERLPRRLWAAGRRRSQRSWDDRCRRLRRPVRPARNGYGKPLWLRCGGC